MGFVQIINNDKQLRLIKTIFSLEPFIFGTIAEHGKAKHAISYYDFIAKIADRYE